MAKLYQFKIRFQDNKEFNGLCAGELVNDYQTLDIVSPGMDITLASNIFPLHITTLPFEWSETDIDGNEWGISIIEDPDVTYNAICTFTYGLRVTTVRYQKNQLLDSYIIPQLRIYSNNYSISYAYFKFGTANTGYTRWSFTCVDGETILNGVRGTFNQAYNYYLTEQSQQTLGAVDIKSSGAIRYFTDAKNGSSKIRLDELGLRVLNPGSIISSLTPLNAVSYAPWVSDKDISLGTLVLSPDKFYYDGNEHTPTATLYDKNGNILLYGTDWGISYSPDRTNPGQKIALAYGEGEYTGEITANWWILEATDISGYTMNIVPRNMRYTGEEQTPLVTIYSRSGELLTPNVDYTLVFGPNIISVGLKYARATGMGDYSGTLEGEWEIFDASINPYMPGGETVPSTGPTDGTWGLPEDELSPSGTIFSDLDAQLYRPYAMTAAQVASFSNQLWNTSILDVISRYFEKPTDVVIALMSYPFEVQSTETASQIAFNWITDWSSVYVTGHAITDELQTLDFGYIDIDRYSGTFYDYQPYSSVQLYLPYIGFVPLKMNEILGRRVYLKYIVDVITGDFSAIIETSWPDQSHEDETTIPVIATYQGNLAKALPLSQQDMFSIYKTGGEIAITGAIAATAGIGAFSAAAEAKEAAVTAKTYEEIGSNLASTMAEQRSSIAAQQSRTMLRTAKRAAAATGINAMYAVGHANSPIIRNGNLDGIAGRTSMQEAFVIISVPDQNIPGNQGILGYPTNLPGPLENYAGYTEVRDIRIKSATATESELAEIEEIVRGGIII